MDTEILTVKEAALKLKVPHATVTELLNEGELPGRLIAGEWRTTARALASYVDGVPLIQTCCTPDGQGMCCPPGQVC